MSDFELFLTRYHVYNVLYYFYEVRVMLHK